MKCFTFWENIKTIINSPHRELRIYSKHMSWHGETCGNKGRFSRYFLPTPMTNIESKFSQVCYFIYKLWYTKCRPWTILFNESVQWLSYAMMFQFCRLYNAWIAFDAFVCCCLYWNKCLNTLLEYTESVFLLRPMMSYFKFRKNGLTSVSIQTHECTTKLNDSETTAVKGPIHFFFLLHHTLPKTYLLLSRSECKLNDRQLMTVQKLEEYLTCTAVTAVIKFEAHLFLKWFPFVNEI